MKNILGTALALVALQGGFAIPAFSQDIATPVRTSSSVKQLDIASILSPGHTKEDPVCNPRGTACYEDSAYFCCSNLCVDGFCD